MPIDPAIIGTKTAPFDVEVERGRLRFFAAATGSTDPIYTDLDAAKAAGHRDLPVPPTFLFSLEMERPDAWGSLAGLGIDLRFVLHGEQRFTYHAMAYAGDSLTFSSTISDVYAKKGGALEFLVRTVDVTRDGEPVAELVNVIVVQNPKAAG